METALSVPSVITAIPIPAVLEKATWTLISNDWDTYKLEKAVDVDTGDGLVWVRKVHNPTQLYAATPDGHLWRCAKCGETVSGARVAHPVWDGLFTCSGGGECEYENAPYCPKCEKQPSFHGSPFTRPR